MIQLNITSNLDRLIFKLNRAAAKQIPFIIAKALTDTAEDCRLQVIRELPYHFQIRNRYVQGGIRKTPANKANLEAIVGSITPFMELQEYGGTRSPKEGKHVAVPIGARPSFPQMHRRPVWPGTLRKKKKQYFAGHIHGRLAIWQRTSRGHVKLMHTLADSANIKPAWEFERTVSRTARERIDRHVDRGMKEIL